MTHSGDTATGAPLPSSPRVIDPRCEADWPAGVPPGIRRYLTALHGPGPARLAENAAGIRGEILRVGDRVLPVLVSDGKPGKASILSPIGHHVLYPIEEIGRRSRWLGRRGVATLVSPLLGLFRAGGLDRAVFVNHWLLSGAPPPDMPEAAWPGIFGFLAARHPGHAIVVQDVKPALDPALADALARAGAMAVPTRTVAIFDPERPLEGRRFKKTRYRIGHALAALAQAEDRRLSGAAAQSQAPALVSLYSHANRERHSGLNPAYTEAFFEVALGSAEFRLQAWRGTEAEDDRIVAFNLQRVDARTIHWSTFGTAADASEAGLYERVAAADIATAKQDGLLLDWGAGALDYKRFRGATLDSQVEMVRIAHLPFRQRMVWMLLARLRTLRKRQLARRPLAAGS